MVPEDDRETEGKDRELASLTAADADGDETFITLEGTDARYFEITGSGVLVNLVPFDYDLVTGGKQTSVPPPAFHILPPIATPIQTSMLLIY